MSAAPPQKRMKKQQPTEEEHVCKWAGCTEEKFPCLASLVNHVSNQHLVQQPSANQSQPVRYSCQWEGCSRFDIEQPSRFALISHCRTHTGEKPYFCPIPECEKHFTRSDALAKHVKGVHDLHQHRDAIQLMKHRLERNKLDMVSLLDLDTMSEEKYAVMLRKDYEARMPWWFSKRFVNVLKTPQVNLRTLQDQPMEMKQHEVACARYNHFLEDPDPEDLLGATVDYDSPDFQDVKELVSHYKPMNDSDIENKSLDELRQECDKLSRTFLTTRRINGILNKNLQDATKEKRTLWAMNQILLDANIQDSLPPKHSDQNGNGESGVFQDELDNILLKEGMNS